MSADRGSDDRGAGGSPTDATERYAIGVDGGGTGGRAWVGAADGAANGGDAVPRGRSTAQRPCNPYAVGPEAAADAVLHVIRTAWEEAGYAPDDLTEAWVCAGLAGVDRPEDGAAMRAALEARGLHGDRLELIADPWVALEGALPAAGPADEPRVLLVAGTGSAAVGVDGTRRVRVGGWGSRVGDEGSGAWLGLEAVRATLHALDGRAPAGALAEAVQEAWGRGPEALVGRSRDAASAAFAALAPVVLALSDDDPVAAALRTRAVAHLADLVTTAAGRFDRPAAAWCHTGGVAQALEAEIRAALAPALAERLRPPAGPPVAGAWARARRAARRAAR